jgi:hypothetical protein
MVYCNIPSEFVTCCCAVKPLAEEIVVPERDGKTSSWMRVEGTSFVA